MNITDELKESLKTRFDIGVARAKSPGVNVIAVIGGVYSDCTAIDLNNPEILKWALLFGEMASQTYFAIGKPIKIKPAPPDHTAFVYESPNGFALWARLVAGKRVIIGWSFEVVAL